MPLIVDQVGSALAGSAGSDGQWDRSEIQNLLISQGISSVYAEGLASSALGIARVLNFQQLKAFLDKIAGEDGVLTEEDAAESEKEEEEE